MKLLFVALIVPLLEEASESEVSFCFLDGLDGFDFSRYNNYYCKSSYKTVTGVVAAMTKCREDIKCAMISSLDCNTEDSEYTLCEKSTELLPKLESCTLWKKGENS